MVRPFEHLDRGFGSALGLQIRLRDINVIVGLLEALALDGLDALQQLATLKDRLGAGERVGGLRRRFAFGEAESVGAAPPWT